MRQNSEFMQTEAEERLMEMKVIGITGGVGSGKSRVLAYLEDVYGAVICQMDETARDLQKKGTRCFDRIVESFGTGILDRQGELDRAALGSIVFANEEKMRQLNGIVHPEVIREVERDIRSNAEKGKRLYVVEAALLLTWEKSCAMSCGIFMLMKMCAESV